MKTPIERVTDHLNKALKLAEQEKLQLVAFWTDANHSKEGKVQAAVNCESPFIAVVVEQLNSALKRALEPQPAQTDAGS